jgi:glutathione synthase/RimK-type ligase-like ATP-grasp enzyme
MPNKVLVLGSSNDPTTEHVLAHLITKCPLEFVDVNEFSCATRLHFDEDHGAGLSVDDKVFILTEYKSFFQRFWPPFNMIKRNDWNRINVVNAVSQYLRLTDALVINRPRAGYSNSSKVLHNVVLAEAGFNVPEFIVTSCDSVCRAVLIDPHRLVTKGTSAARTRAAMYEVAEERRLNTLRRAPVMFQRHIIGTEYRLHVLGTQPFGLRIICDRVDYRYATRDGADVEFEPADLPKPLSSKCVDYCRSNNLVLAGFDFIHSARDDVWHLLEVNPAPGFDFFDTKADNKIVNALGQILSSVRPYPDAIPDLLRYEEHTDIFIEEHSRPLIRY